MINDSVSETLDDAMFQDVIATVVEAIEDGITVAEAEDNGDGMNVAMVEEATTETRSRTSYSTSQESRKIKRLSSLKLGDVVLVPLSDVDCTKVDGKTLAGVIVTINKDKSTCTVAVKEGLLHRAYAFHALRVVPKASNNRTVMDLEDAYLHWKGLPKISFCFIRWSWRSRTGQVQLQG